MNFDIIDWNPINSYNEFNLLSRIQIKPTVELLYLFKNVVDHNLLCTITETETYDKTEKGYETNAKNAVRVLRGTLSKRKTYI